jgi:hypothetical protein
MFAEEGAQLTRKSAPRLLVSHAIQAKTWIGFSEISHEGANGTNKYGIPDSLFNTEDMELDNNLLWRRAAGSSVGVP